ncbi:MAG: hypothetical protein V5786_06165 [Psychromonas sp.]
MDLILQVWGGGFYLVNKILFARAEGKQAALKKSIKIKAWIVYILGVPAWIIILVGHQNWIAASIEAGGIPAMLLGLYNTYHDNQKHNRLFNRIVAICTYSSLVFGLVYSMTLHGGIVSISQVLEIGVMMGFLLGSYLVAKNNPMGWLFFMLMNLSMATLMLLQDKPILMVQQLVSLCFVAYTLRVSRSLV